AFYAQQARSRRESSLDRVAAAAIDHSRALAGLAGTTLTAWTSAGRRVTALRLEANRLARRRSQLQYALGGAAYAGDDAQAAELRARMREVEEQIADCVREAERVVAQARTRTAQERFATAPTEVRRPDAHQA